jgi:opacity protein-like surface antigen
MSTRWFVRTLVAVVALASNATAGQWYAGADIGYVENDFEPAYVFASERAPLSYVNESDGAELGLYVGCAQQVAGRLSVAGQFRATLNNVEWTLSLPEEPATFCYEIPYTLGLSVLPTLQITDSIWIFGELGLVSGRVREEKTSSVRSSYDFDEARGGTVFGCGVGYNVTEEVTMSLQYRVTSYDSFSYRTFLPNGDWEETITDNPSTASYSLGCTYRF